MPTPTPQTNPQPRCARCGGPLLTSAGGAALSRFDNHTAVCTSCGSNEALHQAAFGSVPDFSTALFA